MPDKKAKRRPCRKSHSKRRKEARDRPQGRPEALGRARQRLSWRACPEERPHQQARVISHRSRQVPFGQLLAAAQRGSPQTSMVEHVRKAAFELFAALAQQGLAAGAAPGPARPPQRRAFLGAGPLQLPASGLRIADNCAHAQCLALRHRPGGKVTFVPASLAAQFLMGLLR